MKTFLFAFAITVAVAPFVRAEIPREKIDQAERIMWSRFFLPRTNLFYECLTSFDDKTCQNHLPTADEVKRQYPNPCGYATGMEDCAILGGTALAALADKYEATADKRIAAQAKKVLAGLDDLVQPDGFVARGICPEDGKSVYANSSIDQYTHCVHGLWKYYRSPLSDSADRSKIKGAILRVAERLRRNVNEKNDFDSLRLDGKHCALRISSFTFDSPHSAARLPMIYAAAWDVSKDSDYLELYRGRIEKAVAVSEKIAINSHTPIYSFLQMQISLELLRELETDPALKARISALMDKVVGLCLQLSPKLETRFAGTQTDTLYGDWRNPERIEVRNGYNIPKLGHSRDVWRTVRETGELPLIAALAPSGKIPPRIGKFFEEAAGKTDYERCASCGVLFHWAAYWTAQKQKLGK